MPQILYTIHEPLPKKDPRFIELDEHNSVLLEEWLNEREHIGKENHSIKLADLHRLPNDAMVVILEEEIPKFANRAMTDLLDILARQICK
jgi:hypothetical protein